MPGSGRIVVYKAIQDDGTSYWPTEFPISVLKAWENELGPVSFPSQYQSSPLDTQGNYLKKAWLHWYPVSERPTSFEKIIIFIDPAVSQKATADFFALAVGGKKENKIYLLDLLRTRAEIGAQVEIIKDKHTLWHPHEVIIEASGQQLYLVQQVKRETMFNIVVPDKDWHRSDKKTRFEVAAAHFNASRAVLPGYRDDDGEWQPIQEFEPFLDEWVSFPAGLHDDTLDAVTGVIDALISGIAAASAEEPDKLDDVEEFVSEVIARNYNRELTNEEKQTLAEFYGDTGAGNIRRLGFFRDM